MTCCGLQACDNSSQFAIAQGCMAALLMHHESPVGHVGGLIILFIFLTWLSLLISSLPVNNNSE